MLMATRSRKRPRLFLDNVNALPLSFFYFKPRLSLLLPSQRIAILIDG